jgi:excisionase family DNA binding protein
LSEKHEYGRGRPARLSQSGRYLDAREAGECLGVGERFVRRLVAERRIPYYKLGRYVRFAAADLDAFIAASDAEAQR